MRAWEPPVRIPAGAFLVVKKEMESKILSHSRTLIYLGWDTSGAGMKILFPDGTISTHDPEDVLNFFEYAPL